MTTKLIPLLLLSLLAADASAQCGIHWQEELAEAEEAQKAQAGAAAAAKNSQDAKLKAAIESTLTAMNDGPEQGEAVISYARSKKISVELRDILDLSASQGSVVGLSRKIGAYPRAMGPRVAWEIAGMMLADMPASSEKEYMRRSITARVFIELGGEPAKLPVVETLSGDKDEVLSKEMKLWTDHAAPEALKKIAAATGTKSLQYLLQDEDPSKPGPVDAAVKRYAAFMLQEMTWRQMYPR